MIEELKAEIKGHIGQVCLIASVAIVAVQMIVPGLFDLIFGTIQIALVYIAMKWGSRSPLMGVRR